MPVVIIWENPVEFQPLRLSVTAVKSFPALARAVHFLADSLKNNQEDYALTATQLHMEWENERK